ncbi:RRP15-like protein [Ambystoma mexicanum]|uniref:RRP15-like protein n=1 Tax=Ambystoma mexicanum TaxID=8296 RepID=UPI0037E991B1
MTAAMATFVLDTQCVPFPQSEDSEGSTGLADESISSDVDDADLGNTVSDGTDQEADHEAEECPGAGWADAMAKILNKKTPDSKPIILLKNKKLQQEKEKEQQEKLEKRRQLDKKREWEMMCRVKPDVVKDRETERNLQRIATRGVVQLFNAVRKHQSNIDEKVKQAGRSESKRAKLISSVSKRDFINVLRGKEQSKALQSETKRTPKSKTITVKSEAGPEWNILRDDFMMGASMKDWDKKSDDDDDAEQEPSNPKDDGESDSDS